MTEATPETAAPGSTGGIGGGVTVDRGGGRTSAGRGASTGAQPTVMKSVARRAAALLEERAWHCPATLVATPSSRSTVRGLSVRPRSALIDVARTFAMLERCYRLAKRATVESPAAHLEGAGERSRNRRADSAGVLARRSVVPGRLHMSHGRRLGVPEAPAPAPQRRPAPDALALAPHRQRRHRLERECLAGQPTRFVRDEHGEPVGPGELLDACRDVDGVADGGVLAPARRADV